MRLKGEMTWDGGQLDTERNLFYLSLHTLDSESGVSYAQGRIGRELIDCWLQKKISFNGQKFEDAEVTLSEQALATLFLALVKFVVWCHFAGINLNLQFFDEAAFNDWVEFI